MKKGKEANNLHILQLEELNWKQIDQFDRSKTVFFIPISPLEEHGPHLPVGTDLLTAREVAKEAIKGLWEKKPELQGVLFPVVPLGYTKMATGFPGTVATRPRVVQMVVYDICTALADHGFKYFVICTIHMDLGHLKGIYAGMQKAMKKHDILVIEPWGPYFHGKEVEKREPEVGFDTKKEIHAGFRETSLMKYQYPYLVDESHSQLQSIYRNLYSPKAVGKTFKDLGITLGYVGSPARADSNYGRWYFQETVNAFVDATMTMVEKGEVPELPPRAKLMMKSLFWV